jgi:aspartyl/asparaginyl-tRNA synthetase
MAFFVLALLVLASRLLIACHLSLSLTQHMHRYATSQVRKVFKSRAFIVSSIRRMLDALDYIEVETPVLSAQPGGAEAKPFLTHHNSLDVSSAWRMDLILLLQLYRLRFIFDPYLFFLVSSQHMSHVH